MRVIDIESRVKRLAAIVVVAAAIMLVAGSLSPAGGAGPLAPAKAEAFQGGWDRNHWWIKVSRGEVYGGVVSLACGRYVPPPYSLRVCAPVGQTAKRLIGNRRGFWAEFYPPRWVSYPNGLGWWTPPYTRVGTW